MQIKIYKITSPTNRVYIGQTKNINKRLSYYSKGYCKTQPILYNSIKKHGWNNHKFEVLENVELQEIADNREQHYIDHFECNFRKNKTGLNCTDGGKSNHNGCSIKVYQYDLNGNYIQSWGSIVEAASRYNINATHISRACKGFLKTSGGYIWSYKNEVITTYHGRDSKKYKNIGQFDLGNNLIKIWDRVSDINRSQNIPSASIIQGINKNYKTYGFFWKLL